MKRSQQSRPVVICTGRDVIYDSVPVFDIQPGQAVVDYWTVSRGPGTIGVAHVHEVVEPARWDGSVVRKWGLICRRDVYVGTAPPHNLPVLMERGLGRG